MYPLRTLRLGLRCAGNLDINVEVILQFGFYERGQKSSFGNSLVKLHTLGLYTLIRWTVLESEC
jgi:hypothetical protein